MGCVFHGDFIAGEKMGALRWGFLPSILRGQVLLTAQHLTAFREDPVLAGKSRARVSDFARAVRQANEEE